MYSMLHTFGGNFKVRVGALQTILTENLSYMPITVV